MFLGPAFAGVTVNAVYSAGCRSRARNCGQASAMTLSEERKKSRAMTAATAMSGHGEAVIETSQAAARTPRLAATSFLEHSNVLARFTSWLRYGQSRATQERLATSAML